MYRYMYRRRPSYAPQMSRKEIEQVALGMIREYKPELLTEPQEVDVEDFTQNYLKAHHDFQHLSNNGIYLGMTVFDRSERVVVYDREQDRAEYITEEANTIIIDKQLLVKGEEHRYRFTFGHEAGHIALPHAQFFRRQAEERTAEQAAIACRDIGRSMDTGIENWSDEDWIEWQADIFASALLMPEPAVKKISENVEEHDRNIFGEFMQEFHKVIRVSRIFNVSEQAAKIRLRRLGLIS